MKLLKILFETLVYSGGKPQICNQNATQREFMVAKIIRSYWRVIQSFKLCSTQKQLYETGSVAQMETLAVISSQSRGIAFPWGQRCYASEKPRRQFVIRYFGSIVTVTKRYYVKKASHSRNRYNNSTGKEGPFGIVFIKINYWWIIPRLENIPFFDAHRYISNEIQWSGSSFTDREYLNWDPRVCKRFWWDLSNLLWNAYYSSEALDTALPLSLIVTPSPLILALRVTLAVRWRDFVTIGIA